MASKLLERLRQKILAGQYLIPFHAAGEMDDENYDTFDLENIILTGSIIRRQRDPNTHEQKYVVRGRSVEDFESCCVVELGPRGDVVFVTVWSE